MYLLLTTSYKKIMIGGYVRLSRDEDKKNYVSIENQKLIIEQYATQQGLVIDRWYEDDNISGYSFDRPAFKQLVEDMDNQINMIIAKDLSRIGRHNAKVLLFLDTVKEQGKRILLVDDNYDTLSDDDDIIGIKTWYNERYIKDTSKKIKRVFRARQQEGTLYHNVPVGYRRNAEDKSQIEVVEHEAEYIRLIFDLYLKGNGFRKTSIILNNKKIPTPSMLEKAMYEEQGRIYKKALTTKWSDSMVGDLLKNDFYMGTIRFHKRERLTIHGTDKKIPKEEQYIFENNHEPIIDKQTFNLVQDVMKKRVRTNYRGQNLTENIFGGYLYCKDCGSRLTPIVRTSRNQQKYYICNTYNSKGKQYCEYPHSVKEKTLLNSVITYIKLCRDSLWDIIQNYDMSKLDKEKKRYEISLSNLNKRLDKHKSELKSLLSNKLHEISSNPDSREIINSMYNEMQEDLLEKIHSLERQIQDSTKITIKKEELNNRLQTALQIIDEITLKKSITRQDLEILIDKIIVDQNGNFEVHLKPELGELAHYDIASELNQKEHKILATTMTLVEQESRPYTSAKYLSTKLTKLGYPKSKKSILPYIQQMIDHSILQPSDNPLKPYLIIKEKKEIQDVIDFYTNQGQPPFRPPSTSLPIKSSH